MGWIAAAIVALVAAMFVYNYWTSTDKKSEPVIEESKKKKGGETVQNGVQGSSKASTQTALESSKKENGISAPNIAVSMVVTDTDMPSLSSPSNDGRRAHLNGQTVQSSSTSSTQPAKSMPPPPPPFSQLQPTSRSMSPPRLKTPVIGRSPAVVASKSNGPPTLNGPPRLGGGSTLSPPPPPSSAASLRVPQTKVLQNTSMAPSLSTSTLSPSSKQKPSRQVILEPGHSPLDWAALTVNPSARLRGKDAPSADRLIRVTPSRLKLQNGRKGADAWTVYQGKVYNITPYLPFHPGGKGELLRGAGRDSAKLFMEVHPWVNWDGMLAECCVGILVAEEEADKVTRRGSDNVQSSGNSLDEMD